ncbi:hypothetical protein [Nonomuraea sp. WAC 01424]|uniref:hypothetical protein n=1 Tax=Nonomuraea sp. WAC 01424 TaxID=2203200 RepID=UPI000F79198E|nr:hypothetical protein [Nonomuraea sp. WAC 01424]
MPLDDALTTRMADPDFWAAYLFEDDAPEPDLDDEDDEESFIAEFQVGEGLGLVLDLDIVTGYFDLALTAPELAEPITVGWDDQAHFHPHTMRWSELDLLARALALHDPRLRHPGPVLALLARFVVLDEQDDPDVITPLMDAAFQLVRPRPGTGLRPETRDWFELRDLRGCGLRWTTGDNGCLAVEQADPDSAPHDLYSLRTPGSSDFPFAAWTALVNRAEQILAGATAAPSLRAPAIRTALDRCTTAEGRAHLEPLAAALQTAKAVHPVLVRALTEPVSRAESCWAVETLAGLPGGTLVKQWYGPSPLAGAQSWELCLTLATQDRPAEHARLLISDLNDALKQEGLGRAEITGGTTRRDALGRQVNVSTSAAILVRDELPRGLSLISQILRRHNAADTAELRHAAPSPASIPIP